MPAPKVRVRGGQADGPQSAVWLAWTTQRTSDVYVACRHIAANLKVSLHQSGHWRLAYTPGYLLQSGQSGDPSVDRAQAK